MFMAAGKASGGAGWAHPETKQKLEAMWGGDGVGKWSEA